MKETKITRDNNKKWMKKMHGYVNLFYSQYIGLPPFRLFFFLLLFACLPWGECIGVAHYGEVRYAKKQIVMVIFIAFSLQLYYPYFLCLEMISSD